MGDGTAGDGLSRYEEYRGLLLAEEDWKLTRLNPGQKDMVVMNYGQPDIYTVGYFPGPGVPETHYTESWFMEERLRWPNPEEIGPLNNRSGTAHLDDVYVVDMWAVPVPDPQEWIYYGEATDAYYRSTCEVHIDIPDIQRDAGSRWAYFRDWIVGHELGHTILWHNVDAGHHYQGFPQDCLMFFPSDPATATYPQDFCVGHQAAWHYSGKCPNPPHEPPP